MLAFPAKCEDEKEEDLKKESAQNDKKGGVSFVIDMGPNSSESDASLQEKQKKEPLMLVSHFAEFALESIISVFPNKPD